MWDISPTLTKYDHLEAVGNAEVAIKALRMEAERVGKMGGEGGLEGAFKRPIENFYRTDPISRSSVTMSKCTVRHRSSFSSPDSFALPLPVSNSREVVIDEILLIASFRGGVLSRGRTSSSCAARCQRLIDILRRCRRWIEIEIAALDISFVLVFLSASQCSPRYELTKERERERSERGKEKEEFYHSKSTVQTKQTPNRSV